MKKRILTISIPPNTYAELEEKAKQSGLTVATIIIQILNKEVKK